MVPSVPASMRRRESNLTLDGEDEVKVEIERPVEPWMSLELFHTLWKNATMQLSSSCTLTTRQRQQAAKSTGDVRDREDNATAISTDGAETPPDTPPVSAWSPDYLADDFEEQLVKALGEDIVVFPLSERSKHSSGSIDGAVILFGYVSVSDNYGLRTVLLLRLEQLKRSEQVAISIKNTDPIDRTRMNALMSIIQQRIQPGEVPRRPHGRRVDTNTLFVDDSSEQSGSDGHLPSIPDRSPTDPGLPPPAPTRSRSTSKSRIVGRGRSHTIRYRTERSISFEGYLNKKSDLLPSWKVTYCVLEEDTLAYFESREDFISNSKLIGRVQIQAVEDDDMGKSNGFRIVTEGHHVNHLSSRTAFEKDQWKRAIAVSLPLLLARDDRSCVSDLFVLADCHIEDSRAFATSRGVRLAATGPTHFLPSAWCASSSGDR